MNGCEEITKNQLRMIESVYNIEIKNKEDAARWIAEGSEMDSRVALSVCTTLNNWVYMNNLRGEITIPQELVKKICGHYNRYR